jgi:hypothetical protein
MGQKFSNKKYLNKANGAMKKFLVKLIYLPEVNKFQLNIDNKRWQITEDDVQKIINNGRKQLVDVTDVTTEFSLHTPHLTIQLRGVDSRNVFAQILNYIDKVWTSYQSLK